MGPLLLLLALAPPAPRHDLWLEAETSPDHNFTTIGRDEAFAGCYGGAILQLQTGAPAPPGGYHAAFHVDVPEAGWYEILVAASRTDRPDSASPFWFQASVYRPRRFAGYDVATPYGHPRTGEIFGWRTLGRYRLEAGPARLTFRCDERRFSDQAYLLYLDAVALRRVGPPGDAPSWLGGEGRYRAETVFDAPSVAGARLHVVVDGSFVARLGDDEVARGEGWQQATVIPLRSLRLGANRLVIEADGALLAWITVLDRGREQRLAATGPGWRGAELLGPAAMPPYGDMEVQPMSRVAVGPTPIPIKTGNLSVNLIMAAARGEPRPDWTPGMDFDALHDLCNVSVIEDYQCWLPLEPERGRFEWDYYRRNAEELRRRGMTYAVYPWLHFAPAWAMESEFWSPFVSLKNGRTTFAPSIWSPRTLALFDRYYRELHAAMGDLVGEIFVSMACDYGEVGYPIGMADWVVPAPYVGPDFWIGDEQARADFRADALERYPDLNALNAAWGTDFTTPEAIDYPPWCAAEGPDFAATQALPPAERAQVRRRWLDFVDWYLESMVDFAGAAVSVSRRYFADRPHEIKIGFGSERVMFGADYTAFVARSRADGYTVRSTHGKLPPYFYKRFSTAARHYGVRLVTEPPSEVTRDEEIERIFKDATCGTSEYFDYPGNLLGATDIFARYAQYLQGEHSQPEVAFFFPTTDHRLRGAQALPQPLFDVTVHSRDQFDFDVVDERLVRDGALALHDRLVIVQGSVVEADVLARLLEWQAAGGTIIAVEFGPMETVEGDAGPGQALLARAVRVPAAEPPALADAVAAAAGAVRPLLDGRRDGVWTARLPSRILLYNSTAEPRTVTVAGVTVELPGRALGSVEEDGTVMVP